MNSAMATAPAPRPKKVGKNDAEKRIAWCRATLVKLDRQLKATPPVLLSEADLNELKRVLNHCSWCPESHKEYIEDWKLPKALRQILAHSTKLPDGYPEELHKQIEGWERGEYNLTKAAASDGGPSEEDDDLVDSSSDGETDDDDAAQLQAPAMRGILRELSTTGRSRVLKLDPRYLHRKANRFGHNGARVGAWWPYQICALRDGVHGARMGGIYGRKETGCFSVILNGGAYDDDDRGDTVIYTGSGKAGQDQVLGTANQALVYNYSTKQPVRLIRGSKLLSRYAPSAGLRYDGLYQVTNYWTEVGRDGFRVYKFELKRLDNQTPIQRNVPGPTELATLIRR
jgi:hypothetical protein